MNSLDVSSQVALACIMLGDEWFAHDAKYTPATCTVQPVSPRKKKKNSPSLRTDAILRRSNEEGLMVLHVAVGLVESLLHGSSLMRERHDLGERRCEGQTVNAGAETTGKKANE
jgi:hypothetical protein